MKLVIIDYGLGNICSIINMIKKLNVCAVLSNKAEDILSADKLILPGVGAYDYGMNNLATLGLIELLNSQVLEIRKPILGICLGMQLLMEGSEEGKLPGLSWIKGTCKKFDFSNISSQLKIPHMGWNQIHCNKENPLIDIHSSDETRFYFVHSYHAVCDNSEDIYATTTYGYTFPAIIGNKNILGAQFHPEKSHKYGLKLLKNFLEIS